MSTTPRFGLIVVGEEILTGKRQDKHFAKTVQLLGARGLELSWARYVGDDAELLTGVLRDTFASGDVVFSCGGIGGTPDDRTRQCAAVAAGVGIEPHPEGMRLLQSRFGTEALNSTRLSMVEFPIGAEIIPNPVNQIPGFSLREHYFTPGFPSMAWPMIEWVLDTHYSRYFAPGGIAERVITVYDTPESHVTPVLELFVERYPALRMSCLPNSDIKVRKLELGFRGEPKLVDQAMAELQAQVSEMNLRWEETPP